MRYQTILIAAVGGAFAAAVGCGGGADCGPGTHLEGNFCVASPSEGAGGTGAGGGPTSTTSTHAGGHSGSTSSTGTSAGGGGGSAGGGGGSQAGAPTFSGVSAISPASLTSVLISWDAATDDTTAQADIRYAVYLSKTAGDEHYGSPDAIVPHGGTSYLADGLDASVKVFAVVRAIDQDGNQDTNTREKSGEPALDTTPPTFGGATSATSKPGGKVELGWTAATDDLSAPGAISYAVWASEVTPVDATIPPTLVTAPGAASVDVTLPIPGHDYHFVVRAVDAAGNTESNSHEVHGTPGADTLPPTFVGCTNATATDAVTIGATWDAASDDTTPPDQITYTIYAFTTPGPHQDVSTAAAHQDVVGLLTGQLTGLAQQTKYYIVCRATDATGNQDGNVIEKTATTLTDTTPPLFDGVATVSLDTPSTSAVKLTWNAAVDDKTPPELITYDIFKADTSGAQNFAAPFASVVGVTEKIVTVPSNTQAFFVVRARDTAGNEETNVVELTTKTDASFEGDVQPILSSICITCHSIIAGVAQPYYDDGFAYANIMAASADHVVVPFDSSSSLIYLYTQWSGTNCPYMPYNDCPDRLLPQQFNTIKDWIDQGAANN